MNFQSSGVVNLLRFTLVNLLRNWVLNFNRGRWSVYSGICGQFTPFFPTIDLIYSYFNDKLAKNYDTLDVKPLPYVERTFKELKERNIKVVLNTGYNRKTAESLLVKLGWKESNQFDLLITASDVNNNRPQPDMILLAMSKLNIFDPKKVLKVGDSTVDIQEGQNADCLLSIGITSGAHTREQLREADPDFIINNNPQLVS